MTNNNFSLSANNSYSQALYELTEEENSKDQVEEEAQALLKLLSVSQEFRNLIKDPRTTQIDQMNVIKALFEKYKFKDIFMKFLKLLIYKRRLFFLELILRDFLTICSSKRGEIIAKLRAAKNLSEMELNNIKGSLRENFGSNLKLKFTHDPSLLGGLIVQIGSIMIDTSIKNRLQQIENNMIEA